MIDFVSASHRQSSQTVASNELFTLAKKVAAGNSAVGGSGDSAVRDRCPLCDHRMSQRLCIRRSVSDKGVLCRAVHSN